MVLEQNLIEFILSKIKAEKLKIGETIQSLWSGYGKIIRIYTDSPEHKSIILKHIIFPEKVNHPRSWNSEFSHKRKKKSYEVEMSWYKNYSHFNFKDCRIPKYFGSVSDEKESIIILEDLDQSGFNLRKSDLNIEEIYPCIKWLANFHAVFLNQKSEGLWDIGSYWHLDTRPEEFEAIEDQEIKNAAAKIDQILNNCKYKTIIHGDAKVANFCFSGNDKIAVLDFQYTGSGSGMKDLAYFISSCLDENQCEKYESEILDYYFLELKIALHKSEIHTDFKELESEWRKLYPVAWTDFYRFLCGWMPEHKKIHRYTKRLARETLNIIDSF